ncbi:MAG: DEAD/DEAH box helicase [Thermoanaerobaculia bacterium]
MPTEIQALAWPAIAAGEHVLISAPTGCGKTLAAFLWAIDRLATGAWTGGTTRVVYVSPLKALNADVERNLLGPLAEVERRFATAGVDSAPIRVATRSGDTPASERQKLLRRPPEILITTPESLNLLLLSKAARRIFAGVTCVLLDEIHAVAGSKRGTHLITAVDRLVRLAGEFQRVALSATVRPLDEVAAFVGGLRLERGEGGEPRHVPRAVRVLASHEAKRYDLTVRLAPASDDPDALDDAFWTRLAADIRPRLAAARSTLIFTNSRRMAERFTRELNAGEAREVAWSHHGSLAREIRQAVERRLKEGQLPALVATSSLELGIDVGALDQVLLVQTPRAVASAAQRIGRAGHRVGEVSRGVFFPTHPRDLLQAAVVARAVAEREIEPLRVVRNPLDVLAQVILGMLAAESWEVDGLFLAVRTSDPYRDLPRRQFDLVLEMLAGRYAESRIAELRPRIAIDRLTGRATARAGLVRELAERGGTIPDRGYFQLRLEDSRAKLGELDEEFVWERSLGDVFTLGAQSWRIRGITHNDVLVAPARGGPPLAPFWRADEQDRDFFLSEKIGQFLERADGRLDEARFASELESEHALEPPAAAELVRLLREQRIATGTSLPHRRHLLVELSEERVHDASRRQIVLYTLWGGRVNRPLAHALAAAWEEGGGLPLEVVSDDDALLVIAPRDADLPALLRAIDPERIEELLRRRLEGSGFFGARFRENAGRALLLPRGGLRRRTPLWLARESAKKLLSAVERFDDFPILLETWRTCLADEFDLPRLKQLLAELGTGEIRISTAVTSAPSPFAANLVWKRTNRQMYEDDEAPPRGGTALAGDLLREVALAGELRPEIPPALAEEFRRKAHRLLPGYPPRDALELVEWVKERLWIPLGEWRELRAAIADERADEVEAVFAAAADKLLELPPGAGGGEGAVVAREQLPRLERALGRPLTAPALRELAADPEALAGLLDEWLRAQPPLAEDRVAHLFALEREPLGEALARLVATEIVVHGPLLAGAAGDQVASRRSFETLMRWRRAGARADFQALPLAELALFRAVQQGLVADVNRSGIEALEGALEPLFGLPLPAAMWEEEILPARLDPYHRAWLDSLAEESGLRWLGCGAGEIALCLEGDVELFVDPRPPQTAPLLARLDRPSGLAELAQASGESPAETARELWRLAFAGEVWNDSFRALRQGVESDFEPDPALAAPLATPGVRRASFRRWSAPRPAPGRWSRVARPAVERDPFDEDRLARDRARVLLARHGVVFRELLAGEPPPLAWSRLARTLRLLELAGEVVGGQFFRDVPGLQFATPGAIARLRSGLPEGAVWWHSALDPVSLCGVDLPALRGRLPRRIAANTLVWRGSRLALEVRRSGRELEFHLAHDEPGVEQLLRPLEVRLTRQFRPASRIEVETINGERADRSPYLPRFARFVVTRGAESVALGRRYDGARDG